MIDALRDFLHVAAHGNFSKAASARDLAVSSVTRKIDALEADLGVKLFNRSSRAVTLTEAGEKFVLHARNILDELADARNVLSSVHAEPRGLLSVTAPATFGRWKVAPAVASFLKQFPLLEVDLQFTDAVVDIAAERIDVAIRIGVLPDSDLLATALAPQRRIACASPDYLARHGRPARPEDLLQHNCLTLRTAPLRVGWWQFAGVNRNRPLAIHGSLRTDDSDALLHGTLAGLGIAHLATWLISDEVASGRLVALFPQEMAAPPPTASAIHAVRIQGRSTLKAKLFVDHLRACFGVDDRGVPDWDRALARRRPTGARRPRAR